MNIKHIHAVTLAGFQYWLSDKKTILMRLFLWPNLVPLAFMLFVSIGLGVMMLRSVPGGDVSTSGGVSFTVYGEQTYAPLIGAVLSDKKTNFSYIKLVDISEGSVRTSIKEKVVTFALNVGTYDNGNAEISIVYDRERDYIHKKWIEEIKDRGPDIALAIRKARFDILRLSIDNSQIAYALAPINIDVVAFGKSNGSMAAAVMVFFLWGILFVAPLDAAASIASSQMLSDTSEDFISIWKAAGVKPGDIILGRFISSLGVFVLALVAFFLYVFLWTSLYIYIADLLVGAMNQKQLSNEDLYMLTTGFKELIEGINIGQVFSLFIMLISTGALVKMLRLRLSIHISDLEQVRTKLKPIEMLLYNLPIVGFVAGTLSAGFATFSIPLINLLVMMQYFFKGGVSCSILLTGVSVNAFFTILVYLNARKHIGSQARLISSKD
jgi:hypothetical protein|tara:strand:- start:21919 stop:23232 length:1314 start_codon:yes stop_codon:yes gene_type:complete